MLLLPKTFGPHFSRTFRAKETFLQKNITRIKCNFLDKDKNNNNQKNEWPWHFLFGSRSFCPALGGFDHSPAVPCVFWTQPWTICRLILLCSGWSKKMLPWIFLLQTFKRNVIKRTLKRCSQKVFWLFWSYFVTGGPQRRDPREQFFLGHLPGTSLQSESSRRIHNRCW